VCENVMFAFLFSISFVGKTGVNFLFVFLIVHFFSLSSSSFTVGFGCGIHGFGGDLREGSGRDRDGCSYIACILWLCLIGWAGSVSFFLLGFRVGVL